MFNQDKLFRYREFTIPFVAYRAGDFSRDDFLELLAEVKALQGEQHQNLLDLLEEDVYLLENHHEIFDNLVEVTRLLDEAVEIAEEALLGPEELEEERLEESLETFKQGTLMLADAHYDLDEVWERENADGML